MVAYSSRGDGGALRAWMETLAPTCSAPVRVHAVHVFLRGAHNYSLRTYLAARCVRGMAADRTHDSTPLVDDGRASASALWRAILAPSVWTTSGVFERWFPTISGFADSA